MPTISVRITEEEKRRLLQYGPLSETVREALEEFLKEKKRRQFLDELKQFQVEHPVKVDSDEIVRTIREGRKH